MALLGRVIKKTIEIGGNLPKKKSGPFKKQAKELRKLMKKAQFTAFGEHYKFSEMLASSNHVKAFTSTVPVHDYNSMFKNWWYRSLNGEPFVTWPGEAKYFALSSGTSEASSKHIPVSKDMIKAIQKVTARQLLGMAHLNLPEEHFQTGILMLGGSTHLAYNGTYYEGDLSGITTGTAPFWFQFFIKPGRKILKRRSWDEKLEEITLNAKNWNIGIICGVPAWIQILFEKIIKHHNVKTIHDIWPNLRVYVSGGVAIGPYLSTFEKLTARPLIITDTYLASEGFIAYQNPLNEERAMQLMCDNGLFFEFIPFTDENFDGEGNLLPNPQTFTVNQVEVDKEYALVMSTCSGAWRYLIGDVVKFTNVETAEIIIAGRTKHFLSLCGEHLSVDNMNKAFRMACDEMKVVPGEFCVCGMKYDGLFGHKWYVGTDTPIDTDLLKKKIDTHLKTLNDDYRVERTHALKDIFVEAVPSSLFFDFLHRKGPVSAQTKFPRVMKGKLLTEWNGLLKEKGYEPVEF